MNPKDKNGNVLNVGDRVVYMKGTPYEDFGVVKSFEQSSYSDEVWVMWSGGSELYIAPEQVELVESSITSVTTDTFTAEDEALLQKLLLKKEQASKLRNDSEKSLSDLVDQMYDASGSYTLRMFVTKNIDEIRATLQAYKQHCM